jgi:hypothetical protein
VERKLRSCYFSGHRADPSGSHRRKDTIFGRDRARKEARHAPLVAHCHLGLGKLYRRTDKREQARKHLATATTTGEGGGGNDESREITGPQAPPVIDPSLPSALSSPDLSRARRVGVL